MNKGIIGGIFLLSFISTVFAQEQTTAYKEIVVTGTQEKQKTLPDVQGTKIYSGKKTSVIDLEEAPVNISSNYRQVLQKTPGLLLSEESTPLVSIGYRGLDPHRSQFLQVMKDGIPIHADMFGYPESYYTPPLQVVDHIDFIRGGAALLYGPQPGGAVNYVTHDPYQDDPLTIIEENSGGSHGLYSNYTAATGTQGNLGYYSYFHHRQSQGFRDNNSQFDLWYGGSKFRVQRGPKAHWDIALDGYNEEHGEPGGLTRAAFDADPTQSTRLNDRFELNRYTGSLAYENELDAATHISLKTFGGYYERLSWRQRTSAASSFGTAPSGANAKTNDIEDQEFYTAGTEGRLRQNYEAFGSDENTFTIGTLYYHVTSPRLDKRGATPDAETGTVRKDSDRYMNYVSLFAENLFKFDRLSVTPGVRLENIWQGIQEIKNLDKTTVPLADENEFDFVPLAGLGASFELSENTDIYGNVSQGYRPKIYTQAVPTSSGQTVNGDLEEGKSWQADIGIKGSPMPYLFWDASLFYMEFEDQIGTVGSTGQVMQNVGDARHQGIELATELNVLGLWDDLQGTKYSEQYGAVNLFANLMILDAEFNVGPNDGKIPAYAPDYITRSGVEYNHRDKTKVRFAGTFLDDHFANDSNSANFIVPSYKVWDLTGEHTIYKDNVSVFAGINNIFDEKYFARVRSDGIDPADGRNYYCGLKLIW